MIRAQRRHHDERVKAKAKRIGHDPKCADHLKWCRHAGCRNARRNPWASGPEKETLPERQAAYREKEGITEMDSEGTFVCKNCGQVARDSERCELTGECMSCDTVRVIKPDTCWQYIDPREFPSTEPSLRRRK